MISIYNIYTVLCCLTLIEGGGGGVCSVDLTGTLCTGYLASGRDSRIHKAFYNFLSTSLTIQ